MYSFNARIRYSEVGGDRKLSVPGIVNYLQDCSTFQSEDLKMGIDYLEKNRRAWWLSSWQIVVERYPQLGEEIVVSTWPYCFKECTVTGILQSVTGRGLFSSKQIRFGSCLIRRRTPGKGGGGGHPGL